MMIGILIFGVGLYLVWDYKTDFFHKHKCYRRNDAALDILKERYARSEITEEEFLMKKNILAE
ncbi:SHOCT domain-containing protein [Desulfitobacterium metallireducens]|uniref:Membrane protein n=1 Tax=Desulfitobacterium metallireducens DSM 15288 TaxID=871968 RepID=W0EFP8_9FIRM|nr:SHOCT domain-containing protein [Desulfitobacterium metallireducens]AHF08034.1 membrane protein [Desulfitobacterium metallireducens DSM 15288]